jgi:hypothetical protein
MVNKILTMPVMDGDKIVYIDVYNCNGKIVHWRRISDSWGTNSQGKHRKSDKARMKIGVRNEQN